jgi:hypothetical protein
VDPNTGTKPDATYWANAPNYPIKDLVKDINDPSKNGVDTEVVDAVEMHNEIDLFHPNTRWYPNDTSPVSNEPDSSRYWAEYIKAATRDTYAALKSDPATAEIPVYGPSLTTEQAYTVVGDLSSSIDASNVHWYLAGRNPETSGWGANGYGSRLWTLEYLAKQQSSSDPVVATEGGYGNAINQDPGNISEEVTARYLPRLYLHAFNGGFKRFCMYELVDVEPNPEKDDNVKNFGLLRNDLSEKPAYVALKNLTDLLEDPAPDSRWLSRALDYLSSLLRGVPGSLDYTLSGDTTDVTHTLLQKLDGTFYLILWIGKPSWNPVDGGEDSVPSQQVTLTVDTPIAESAAYLPNTSVAPIGQYEDQKELTLWVPDHPLVVELTPP